MGYPYYIKNKAQEILNERKNKNAMLCDAHKKEICTKYPKINELILDNISIQSKIVRTIFSNNSNNEIEKLRNNAKNNIILIKELLIMNGYSETYLDIPHSCPICKDSGIDINGKKCACVKNIEKELILNRLSKECDYKQMSFNDFDLNLYPSDNILNNKKIYDYCLDYAENFNMHSNSIFFIGAPGVGKTHITVAIAQNVIGKGYDVLYIPFHKLLQKYENAKFGKDDASIDNVLDEPINCDLLILDDLGAEFISNLSTALLYDVVNTRIAENRPTIISSNLTKNDITLKYDERMTSRLFGTFKVQLLLGDDIRNIKRK